MRNLSIAVAAIALLLGGGGLALACAGGASGHGNAGYDQYHEKPGCGPWKSDGYAGGSGYHFGQPPKDDNRGDCPKPPCDKHDHYTGLLTGGSGGGDCCDRRKQYSGGAYGGSGSGGDGGCHDSSTLAPPRIPAILE